jgi:hypothetical protein
VRGTATLVSTPTPWSSATYRCGWQDWRSREAPS